MATFTSVVPHLKEVAEKLIAEVADDELIWPFVGLGQFYKGQGLYQLAEPWREQCLAVARQRLGEEHPDTATSLNNLALLYNSQGRYSEAEPLYKQAISIFQKSLGDNHPNTITARENLTILLQDKEQST